MHVTRICALVLLFTMSFYLAGCCGGSSKERVIEKETVVAPTEPTAPTLTKQLEDLNEAYRKGLITSEEYNAGKKKLLGQ